MTHENTIQTLIRLRECALKDAADVQQIHAEYVEYAEQKAVEVVAELAQAGDYSRLLRELDPEHADDYPDPEAAGPAVHPVVAALRNLADRVAELGLPTLPSSPRVELELDMPQSTATAFMQALTATDGWNLRPVDGPSRQWLEATRRPDGVRVEVKAWFEDGCCWESKWSGRACTPCAEDDTAVPEPFVKASPAQVAEAYASSAEYNRALTAAGAVDDARSAVAS